MGKIYCKMGGLMEDPNFHWEYIGSTNGKTPQEVCDNYAKEHPEFDKDYKITFYKKEKILSYWGWELKVVLDDERMCKCGSIEKY
jgi:hypothetical protein